MFLLWFQRGKIIYLLCVCVNVWESKTFDCDLWCLVSVAAIKHLWLLYPFMYSKCWTCDYTVEGNEAMKKGNMSIRYNWDEKYTEVHVFDFYSFHVNFFLFHFIVSAITWNKGHNLIYTLTTHFINALFCV